MADNKHPETLSPPPSTATTDDAIASEAPDTEETNGAGFSRRDFLKTSGLGMLTSYLLGSTTGHAQTTQATASQGVISQEGVRITLHVNGQPQQIHVEPRTTLAEALREKLNLTGTKVICDRGSCGGCTVQVNGEAVCSCMMLALDAHNTQVTTIEGLAKGDQLHPLQQAFVECDALQCGYCTPGMVMSCKTLLDHNPTPTLDDVKEAVAGNLCRCGTYPHVFEATLLAAKRMKG